MKLHVPHPHAPNMFHRHAADNEQEEHHPSKFKEELVHVKDEISHVMEHTLDTVEHGVDAVDPLHVFSPNEIPTRLVYQEGLLSQTRGDAFPIVCARSNDPYHELQVKAIKNTEFVIENATTKKPVMILQQSQEQYDIYTPSPLVKDQQQPSDAKGDDLYHYAKVIPSDKVLHVYLKDESEPTYIISKAGLAKSYSTGTKHVIRHFGEKEHPVVATTQPWEGKADMLEVHPGENVIFMYLLALIADEMLT